METAAGYDPAVWAQAAGQLGLPGLIIPERHGGGGATSIELGVVFEEMGAVLYCGPFLATAGLAATALLEMADDEAAAAYLPGIAAGTTIATLAWAGPDPAGSALSAERGASGWTVSGTADLVLDGAGADLVLAAARTEAGPSLFAVTGRDPALLRTPLAPLDQTRKLARLRFERTPAALIGAAGSAAAPLRRTADPAAAERLMLLWTRAEAARLTNLRAAERAGREPGPEGSIAKLQMAELNKAIYELCVDLLGTDGLLIDGYAETAPDSTAVQGGADVRRAYLRSLANSIEGGTSEVLRNVLGERVLGMPGEPRADRDVPWRQLRRS